MLLATSLFPSNIVPEAELNADIKFGTSLKNLEVITTSQGTKSGILINIFT